MIRAFALSVRPQQWVKNLIIFAALVFAHKLDDPAAVLRVAAAFGVFCLVSGGNYVLNDLIDVERDRLHPRKKRRPIASGVLPIRVAIVGSVVFEIGAVALGFVLDPTGILGLLVVGYLVLMAAYSLWLKRVVILDVFVIASGFVVRVVAGAVVIDVEVSQWLILCTIFLSLFLGFGKRRAEMVLLDEDSVHHRDTLSEYSPTFLDQMISVCTASVVTCYSLYTLSAVTVEKFGTRNLVFTVPFVIFGIFRYLYLLHRRNQGGSPTRVLLRDVPTLLNVVLWLVVAILIVYASPVNGSP